MSPGEGAESAELLLCARTLRRPVLPVLRYSNKLPHHLSWLRLQHTGRARSVKVCDEDGEATAHRLVPECWNTRLIDGVSDVLFHDVVADVCDCLLQLHEQHKAVTGTVADMRYAVQRSLFSAEQPPLPGTQHEEAADTRQRTAETGNILRQEHVPPSTLPPPPPPLQEQEQSRSKNAALFPELVSARLSLLSEDLAAINQRVATLERAAGRGSGGAFSMGSLEGRVAMLEAAAVSAPPPAELAARVNELEHGIRKAGSTGANGKSLWRMHTGPHDCQLFCLSHS
jgi:hypothetical protein